MAYKSSKSKPVDPIGPACRKKIYRSREEAEEAIRYIRETRYTKDLRTYQCEVCGMWHLTSKS